MNCLRPSMWLLALCLSASTLSLSGLDYHVLPNGPFASIHVLIVDPDDHVIIPVKAIGDEVDRETVLSLAKEYGAVAAINGGFWKADGTPAGILKINAQWHGTSSRPRGAIGWSEEGKSVLIDQVVTECSTGDCLDDSGVEILPMSSPPYTTPEQWRDLPHIVGGTPVLVRNGAALNDFSSESTKLSFLTKRHPRTAVGIRANGDWVFVVVDDAGLGLLGGMSMKSLARFMASIGCVEALNLDGGGSSTMVVDGAVVNEPAGSIREQGKRVEAVSDAILIFD